MLDLKECACGMEYEGSMLVGCNLLTGGNVSTACRIVPHARRPMVGEECEWLQLKERKG